MAKLGWGMALFALATAWLAAAPRAHANARPNGAVLIIAATHDENAAVAPAAEAVRRALLAKNLREQALPVLLPPPTPPDAAQLKVVHELGREVLTGLTERRPASELMGAYFQRLTDAIGLASAVHDQSERLALWNVCVERVQLLVFSGSAEQAVYDAVAECTRRMEGMRDFTATFPEARLTFANAYETFRFELVEITSTPSECEVLVYGAPLITTHAYIHLQQGPQELQVRCGDDLSYIRRFNHDARRALEINMAGERALRLGASVPILVYPSSTRQAAEHAATYAREARASSFVLISLEANEVRFDHLRAHDAKLLGSTRVAASSSADELQLAAEAVFRKPLNVPDVALAEAPNASRARGDWWLGGALFSAGAALAVYPLLTIARDGACTNDECRHVYRGGKPFNLGLLGAAGVLAGSGIAVLTVAPFGRRAALHVGVGQLHVRGMF
jgi:hypothetical protein